MTALTKNLLLTVIAFFTFSLTISLAQAQHSHEEHSTCSHHKARPLDFVPNQNQFHENVLFRTSIGGLNKLYLEETGFTYLFHDTKAEAQLHDVMLKQKARRRVVA